MVTPHWQEANETYNSPALRGSPPTMQAGKTQVKPQRSESEDSKAAGVCEPESQSGESYTRTQTRGGLEGVPVTTQCSADQHNLWRN